MDWERRLKNFDRVWARVGARPAPPPPPGPPPGPWGPPPPPPGSWGPLPPLRPPKKRPCSHAVRFCPRGFGR